MNSDLASAFFQFAEYDLKIAKFLEGKGYYVQSIYHMGQAFEKIIKSYYILIKTNIDRSPQHVVYSEIINISHEIEESSLNLLIEVGNIDRQRFSEKANRPEAASNPNYIARHEKLVAEIDGYLKRLTNLMNKQLDKEFVDNIKDFTDFVKKKHRLYTQGTRYVKGKKKYV